MLKIYGEVLGHKYVITIVIVILIVIVVQIWQDRWMVWFFLGLCDHVFA